MVRRYIMNEKLIAACKMTGLALLISFMLASCGSVNSVENPEKMYVESGTVDYIIGKMQRFYHDTIPGTFDVTYDRNSNIFVKDLPAIWSVLGYSTKELNKLDYKEVNTYLKKGPVVVIYSKPIFLWFGSKLVLARVFRVDGYRDGTYAAFIDNPDSQKETVIEYTRIVEPDYLTFIALSPMP